MTIIVITMPKIASFETDVGKKWNEMKWKVCCAF